MATGSRACITLSNVMYDIEQIRAPREVVKRVLGVTVDRWVISSRQVSPDDSEHAAEMLTHTLDSADETHFCRGPSDRLELEAASRIVDGLAIQQFYLLNASRALAVRPHVLGILQPVVKLTRSQIKPGATVRGNRPHAWITKTSTIADLERSLMKTPDAFATRVRDFLGLDHYTTHELFEMRYPTDALSSARVAAPTFVDGACREVYRSVQAADGWGRAVDLGSLSLEEGAPEAVHTPIAFTSRFSFRRLGVVRSSRPAPLHALSAACPRAWKPEDLQRIEDYVR